MNRLRKLWSLTAICGMMVGLFPMSIFAETIEEVGVAINQVELTNTEGQAITENNRIKHKEVVKTKLSWSLAQATLIDDGTLVSVDLPANLHFPEQSGSLGEAGNYQVSNQKLIFQLNKNYQATEDGRAPDFSSAKFYEGAIELSAEPTSEEVETETVDFGNNLVSTIYYDKKVDPAADPLEPLEPEQETRKIQTRAHEPNLNKRPVDLFTNIKITDSEGKEFTAENPAVKDANIQIHFDWMLEDDEIIKAGDYYTYQLPDYFSIHNPVSGPLNNGENTLGQFTLTKEGLLTVTFNEKGENLSDRQGTIDLRTELKVTTDTETIEIPTTIKDSDGEEITIKIPVVKADIDKIGMIAADNNSVTWTIILNEERRDLRNAVITDIIPDGLAYSYASSYVMNDDAWVSAPDGFIKYSRVGNEVVGKFSEGIMNKPVKIVLSTTIKDRDKKEFENTATISGDNFISNSSTASVSFDKKDNYKYSTDYDINTGKFNWEIKATYTNPNGILKDWTYYRYHDPSTANHYLLKETFKVFDENEKEIPSEKWFFSDEKDSIKKDGEYVHLTLNFVDAGVYIIRYTTQSFEVPTPIKAELKNNAIIKDGGKENEINGNVKPDVEGILGVKKTAKKIDYSNNTINWEVAVNQNRLLMKNAVITDKFSSLDGTKKSGLQLIPSTLKLVADDGSIKTTLDKDKDYLLKPITGDSEYTTGFIIELIGKYKSTEAEITISYSTDFFMDRQTIYDDGSASRQFVNSAVVTYSDKDGNDHTDGHEASAWLTTNISFNGVKYGKYLSEGKEVKTAFSHENPFKESTASENSVYWSAVFNTWKTTIPKNTVIKEALGEGQKLKELVIYDVNISSGGTSVASLDKKWEEGKDYEYSLEDGVPVIKLKNETKKTFAVFVSAKASDEVPKYKNVATMTIPGNDPLKVEGTVEKSDKKAWIDKKGEQGSDDDYRLINWSVVLNKDGHKVVNPVVTDTVKINEQTFVYDNDKKVVVNVYKAKKEGSNFVKDGPAIEFAEDKLPTVTSNSLEGTQTLTINLGDSIDIPYIIEYQTQLDPGIQNNEIITNSASLEGNGIQYHEVTTSVEVKSTDGEGTSSGKNGTITFRKVDEGDQLITTGSALFDLYRKDKDGNRSLVFSDIEVKGDKIIENGSEVDQLSNLRYGTYIIVETKAPGGYTKDDTEHEITISSEQANYTFTLKNKSTAKLSTSIILKAKKDLSGRPLKADEFSFKLKGDSVNQTKKNAANGEVEFDQINYTEEGKHEYTISEVIPSETEKETGMTYDETKYKVTVTVEEKDGKLEATAVYEGVKAGEVPVFENKYKALPGSVQLKAEKDLTGRPLKDDEFSFTLKGDSVDQTKKNDAEGKVVFDEISYDKAGTYEYTISEVIPSETEKETGMTYDETKYKVTVTVEEKDGKLEAIAVYEGVKAGEVPVFENKYKALPGSVQLKAQKDLTGRPLKADEFSFKLKGDSVDQTKKNDAKGQVVFDEISYDKAGTYEYTISEAIPSTKEIGMTYDETEYKVTVTVQDKDGKLEATAVYEGIEGEKVPVFKNKYKALPGSVQLKAKKELTGRTLKADEFSFNLKGDSVDQTKKNDDKGQVFFDEIIYDKAGQYEYTISEVIPSETEKETGITYDETKYKVTVTVKETGGKLEATAVYENVKEGEVPVFKNKYKALPGSVQLEAKKELSGRPIKADEFSFKLKGDSVDQTKENDKDGNVIFDPISYDKAGTYEYTITEEIPSTKEVGMTYDETKYKVTVTVEDKAGKLEATAVYENVKEGEVPVFKNKYKALPGSVQLKAEKDLNGRTLKADEFSFNLKGDSVDQTKKNNDKGQVVFDEINYTEAGTYRYTISEAIPTEKETGITYDDTEYKVTVTVEDKGGKLEATAIYENVESGKVPTFKNIFTPEKEVPVGEILLKKVDSKTGKTLADAEFKLVDSKDQLVVGHEKIVTGEDGTIFIKGLNDGAYKLIETKAPKGYQIDKTPIEFTVKNSKPSKKEISKENDPIGLPDTGSSDNTKTNITTTYRNGTGSSTTTTRRLPSTGSIRSNGLIILGLFFLAMIVLVVFGKRKKV